MTDLKHISGLPLKSATEPSIATLVVVSFLLTKRVAYPAQPLSLPVLTREERLYVNDQGKSVVHILPKTDGCICGYLELIRWRHDFPPPQNIVARQLGIVKK